MSAESLERTRVEVVVCGDDALLVGHGEFDIATRDVLAAPLGTAVAARLNVTVDLAAVRFLSCDSVRQLASAGERLRRQGRRIRVVNASAPLRRVFVLLGADHLLAG